MFYILRLINGGEGCKRGDKALLIFLTCEGEYT